MVASACCLSVVFLFLYVASAVAADTIGKVAFNAADELAAIANANRTAHKLPTLYVNPRLGCIAVQYIKAYEGDCDAVGGTDEKKTPESAFSVTFASKCGVRSSTLAPITGRFLGCQVNYVDAAQAFSDVLITNPESLDILYSENHTQVGVAVAATDGGSPYFWCVLFSNGKPNSTFVFDHAALMKLMMRIMVLIIVTDLAVRSLLLHN